MTTAPQHLYAFVHFDGTVTLTNPMHSDAMYTRSDIAEEWREQRDELLTTAKMARGYQMDLSHQPHIRDALDSAIAKAESRE